MLYVHVYIVVRGVNSFAQFSAALSIVNAVTNVVVNALAFAGLSATGYSQNDDDKLPDDKVDTRYEWTDDTLW